MEIGIENTMIGEQIAGDDGNVVPPPSWAADPCPDTAPASANAGGTIMPGVSAHPASFFRMGFLLTQEEGVGVRSVNSPLVRRSCRACDLARHRYAQRQLPPAGRRDL